MSFLNIGADGPPNHTLEIEGDMFVSNVEQGTITNFVPVDIQGNFTISWCEIYGYGTNP